MTILFLVSTENKQTRLKAVVGAQPKRKHMPYRQRVPQRVPEVEVDDGYYEPPVGNRGSLLLFLILVLVIGWVLFTRNEGREFITTGWGSQAVDWSTSDRPVAPVTEERPFVERPVVTRPLPLETPRVRRPVVAPTPLRRSVELVPVPAPTPLVRKGKFGGKPAIGRRRELNVIGYAWLIADGVNLRRGPGTDYDVIYLLPENWPVAVLVESDVDDQGEVWTHVRTETPQGVKEGWLNRRFLSY
jgi:hypothetical protein